MSKPNSFKRWIAAVLAASVAITNVAIPVSANEAGQTLDFWKTDIKADPRLNPERPVVEEEEPIPDDQIVRVSIVLEEESTIDAGYEISTLAIDPLAIAYRDELRAEQETVETKIEKQVLDGDELDVVWNLTLAANLISANVEYGQIEDIKSVKGVKDVVIEMQYEPAEAEAADKPNMGTSSSMIGSGVAYAGGYTGAGSKVAIIDTGIDSDHQSFDAGAFEYSLNQLGYNGDLLEKSELTEELLKQLNIYAYGDIDASELYVNSKIPFAYNYVDHDYDITHDNDKQGEHGSHVTGISAANAYIPNGDGTYSPALEKVKTQGVAPDAQIITMKVFGKGGGAYDSDYMVAIEDAILLGADSINLSLGSSMAGLGHNDTYQNIMDKLANENELSVVTMSAGNNGYYAENADYGIPYPYGDDVKFATGGSPASYTNSLSVASVDNAGTTGEYLMVGDDLIFYTQTSGYGNPPYSTLAGQTFDFVVINNYALSGANAGGEEATFAALADIVDGKIAVCYRGGTSFYVKANAALENGAAGVIVINNEPGLMNMDLTGFKGGIPVVLISTVDGDLLWNAVTSEGTSSNGVDYGIGSITVGSGLGSTLYDSEYYTMSSFSSWGIPETLEMKPEITAPGGNIYSVFGENLIDPETGATAGGSDQYENMSGTSMAAPQVAGMAAVLAQYIRENDLTTKTGLTQRQLINSLLMSTAVPVIEEDSDYYYSILNQGSGLANVGKATQASSYILMGEDATASYADGKVKAEIGEVGDEFSYSFTINNFSDKSVTYELSTDLFTQDIFPAAGFTWLDTWTIGVEADVTYGGDAANGKVTVAAGKSANVVVTVEITDDLSDYVNGAYVEGYTFIEPVAGTEGDVDVTHSIPILGFYGSWSDPSMYDTENYVDYIEDDEGNYYETSRHPYSYTGGPTNGLLYEDGLTGDELDVIGNQYFIEDEFPYDKLAIRSIDTLTEYDYGLIRNAGTVAVVISDESGAVVGVSIAAQDQYATFYYTSSSGGSWQYTNYAAKIGTQVGDLGFKENEVFSVSVVAIPEYYGIHLTPSEVAAIVPQLGDGAFLTTTFTVDDTDPTVDSIEIDEEGNMIVTVSDNQNVACVILMSRSGAFIYGKGMPENGKIIFTADQVAEIEGQYAAIYVADYADNHVAYEFEIGEPIDYAGSMFGSTDELYASNGEAIDAWLTFEPETVDIYNDFFELVDATPELITAAAYADGYIFQAAVDGALYVTPISDPGYFENVVAYLGFNAVDMTFNYDTNKIYAIDDNNGLWSINPLNGKQEYVGEIVHENLDTAMGLTADADGVFYLAGIDDEQYAHLFTFTEDVVGSTDHDVDKNQKTNNDDAQALLEYITSKDDTGLDIAAGDVDEDGKPTTYDAYLILKDMAENGAIYAEEVDIDITDADAGVLAYDYDEGLIYLAADASPWAGSYAYLFDNLYVIDLAVEDWDVTNPDFDYSSGSTLFVRFNSIFVVPSEDGGAFGDEDEISITVNTDELKLLVGGTARLEAIVSPWNLEDRSVIWSSEDEAVAVVDANGKVTATGVGKTVITAAANADPEAIAEVSVTVEPVPSVALRANVWGADGEPVWSTIYTDDLSTENIVPLAGRSSSIRAAALHGSEEYLYAHDGDTIYSIDAETYEETALFAMNPTYLFPDAAPNFYLETYFIGGDDTIIAPATGGDTLMILVPGSGNVYTVSLGSEFGSPMAAIAYMGSNPYYGEDYYVIICENGDLWQLLIDYEGGIGYGPLGNTGINLTGVSTSTVDGNNWASLLYDFDNSDNTMDQLFLSYYTSKMSAAAVAVIRVEYDEEYNITYVGAPGQTSFDNDVWPAVGLHQNSADQQNLTGAVADRINANVGDSVLTISREAISAVADRAVVDEEIVGEVVDEETVDEEIVDEEIVDEEVVDEEIVDEETVDEAIVDEEVIDEEIVDEAAADEAIVNTEELGTEENETEDVSAVPVLPVGSLNAVNDKVVDAANGNLSDDDLAVLEKLSNALTIGEPEVDTVNNTITIPVKATRATNALYELSYDSSLLTLDNVSTLTDYSSYEEDTESVLLNFASASPVTKNVSRLVFTYAEEDEDGLKTEITLNAYEVGIAPANGDGVLVALGDKENPVAEEKTKDIEIPDKTPAPPASSGSSPVVKPSEVDVNIDLGGHGTTDAPSTAKPGEDLEFTITPAEGYALPNSITITIGGRVLDPSEYSYDPITGKVVIPGDKITGNIAVDVNFVPIGGDQNGGNDAKPGVSTPDVTPDDGNGNGGGDQNPGTGVTVIFVPALVSAAAIIITKKRK